MKMWEDFVTNSHSICMYLMARARLDLDSGSCGEGIKESDVQKLKKDQEQRRSQKLNRSRSSSKDSAGSQSTANFEEKSSSSVGEFDSRVESESSMFGFIEAETTATLK